MRHVQQKQPFPALARSYFSRNPGKSFQVSKNIDARQGFSGMTIKSAIFPLFFLLALTACGGEIEPGTRADEPPVIRGLTVATVGESALPTSEAYVGTVESRDRGVLAARTDGQVMRIAVREGETVRTGDLLLTIAANQAADQLREAEAGLGAAQNRLAAARARADLAQKTFARYQQLFAKTAITPQEMDRATAEVEEARQQMAAAEAAVTAANAARSAGRTQLAYSKVTAPYAGRVVRREVQEGSTVQPGTPLLVLDRSGALQVSAEIPEKKAGQIAVGAAVQIEIPSLGRTFPAVISEVQSAADPRSRTFRIKAQLPPEAPVHAGLFARVLLKGGDRPSLLVPVTAVVMRGQLTGVYLVSDGILNYRLVKTGREIDGKLEILSGLQSGDAIVVEGVERAHSGARLEG